MSNDKQPGIYRDHLWTPYAGGDEAPVDLKPYLKNSLLHKLADLLYRNTFQPISNLLIRWRERRAAKHWEKVLRNIP